MGGCASKTATVAGNVGSAVVSPLVEAKGDVNSRCNIMLRSTTELVSKLKEGEKKLRQFHAALNAALDANKIVLDFPLPGIYESVAEASEALRAHAETVGGPGYTGDAILKVKADLTTRFNNEALNPLDTWLKTYGDVQAKQKLLNKAFGDMEDAKKKTERQRRSVEELRLQPQHGNDKLAAKLHQAQATLNSLETSLQAATDKYTADEAAQYERVVALNKDAITIRAAMRSILQVVAEHLLAVRDVISDKTEPLPRAGTTQAAEAAAAAAVAGSVATPTTPGGGPVVDPATNPFVASPAPGGAL